MSSPEVSSVSIVFVARYAHMFVNFILVHYADVFVVDNFATLAYMFSEASDQKLTSRVLELPKMIVTSVAAKAPICSSVP
jgi:hypothetical protein